MLKHSGDDFDALFAELKKANTWQSPRCAQDSLVSVNKDPVRRALNSAERDKNHYLQTNRALGNYECEPGPKQKVADFKDLVGKWTKFEVFVNWANDDTGKPLALALLQSEQSARKSSRTTASPRGPAFTT